MTTTSADLQARVAAVLMGTTGAGANVFAGRDWPVATDDLPMILVKSGTESKQSWGRVPASFTVTSVIPVVVKVTAPSATGDAGAAAVRAVLDIFQRQIEVAVINDFDLTKLIQQISVIDIKNEVSSNAEQHVGELTMDFSFEYPQTVQDFAPPATSPLEEVMVYADLVNVFDPHGTYANPPFPAAVEPAPRAEGPDGRVEAGALITLPQ